MEKSFYKVNSKCYLRLKKLIADYDIKQNKLAKEIGIHKVYLSRLANDNAKLTDEVAKKIASAVASKHPEENEKYLTNWLLCRSDFRYPKEHLFDELANEQNNETLLWAGLSSFSRVSGFEIDSINAERPDNANSDGYYIKRDGQVVNLSPEQMNLLQKDICDYVEFILDRIVTGKRSV